MNLVIGSGDIQHLMMGKETEGFKNLLRKFLSDEKPYYNSLNSPIDAMRSGTILEDRYLLILPDNYYCQMQAKCKEMDVFTSTLDFAQMQSGEIVDFDELKTLHLSDFLEIIEPLRNMEESIYLPVIQKKFKKYYNQFQCQLLCTGLNEGNLVFLAVETYNDDENHKREIKENDYIKFRIKRDEEAIKSIKDKAKLFQVIKDYYEQI